MPKLAPLTKLILTAAVSVWALIIPTLAGQAALAGGELFIFALYRPAEKHIKAAGGLAIFAGILAVIQYVFGSTIEFSLLSGLKMFAMSIVFMFTSALRFVPDFLEESQAVREAQACRGYVFRGNPLKRLRDYVVIVEPLVLRAVSRSETMAMSLELRGFGRQGRRQFTADIALGGSDYVAMLAMLGLTIGLAIC